MKRRFSYDRGSVLHLKRDRKRGKKKRERELLSEKRYSKGQKGHSGFSLEVLIFIFIFTDTN